MSLVEYCFLFYFPSSVFNLLKLSMIRFHRSSTWFWPPQYHYRNRHNGNDNRCYFLRILFLLPQHIPPHHTCTCSLVRHVSAFLVASGKTTCVPCISVLFGQLAKDADAENGQSGLTLVSLKLMQSLGPTLGVSIRLINCLPYLDREWVVGCLSPQSWQNTLKCAFKIILFQTD